MFGTRPSTEIKALLHPSIGFMLLPLSHTLLTQGPVLVLASYGSSSLVVLYSASRTLARLGMAGMNAINSSFIAEYSYSLGRPSSKAFKSIGRYHASAMAAAVLGYGAAMWVLAVPNAVHRDCRKGRPGPCTPYRPGDGRRSGNDLVGRGCGAHCSRPPHGRGIRLRGLSVVSLVLSIPATVRWGVTGPAWTSLIVHGALLLLVAARLSRLRSVAPRWTVAGRGRT